MKRKSQVLLLLMSLVCGSAFAEEQVAPHVAFWTSLAGPWTYEISSDGTKGKVTWQMQARGSALMGRFQDDQGNVSVELAGWRPDNKTLVVNGVGTAGNHWTLALDKVTPVSAEGTTEGVLPSGLGFKGAFTGKLTNNDLYTVTLERTSEDGETSDITIVFKRVKPGAAVIDIPWKWLIGYWKIERSDGTSAEVHWSKPRANADYLIGKWENSDGTKFSEIVGWRPDQQALVANAFGARGGYFSVFLNNVRPNQMSGRIRRFKSDGTQTSGTIEINRVNEDLVKTRIVDESDGSVVTETVTRVPATSHDGERRRRLPGIPQRLRNLLRRR